MTSSSRKESCPLVINCPHCGKGSTYILSYSLSLKDYTLNWKLSDPISLLLAEDQPSGPSPPSTESLKCEGPFNHRDGGKYYLLSIRPLSSTQKGGPTGQSSSQTSSKPSMNLSSPKSEG